MITLAEMRDDYDWQEAFGFAGKISVVLGETVGADGFGLDDIDAVLAADAGANDEARWVAIFRLRDGRFAYLTAGCDYTGWDCQSWGQAFVAGSLEKLWQLGVDQDEKPRLAEAVSPVTVVPTIVCKARDLTETLAESIRLDVHRQLDELIAGSERCPYVLTEAGERAVEGGFG